MCSSVNLGWEKHETTNLVAPPRPLERLAVCLKGPQEARHLPERKFKIRQVRTQNQNEEQGAAC